jgi:hypothetical protein
MKIEVSCLISLAMLMLVGCATSRESTHSCGIDHVKTSRLGLEVYFQSDTSFNYFTISRIGPQGPSTKHSVRKGRLVPPDWPPRPGFPGFNLFAPRHFFLDRGGSAGSFNLFGGCDYDIKSDERGVYLHVEGADGDTSDMVYNEDIRPGE